VQVVLFPVHVVPRALVLVYGRDYGSFWNRLHSDMINPRGSSDSLLRLCSKLLLGELRYWRRLPPQVDGTLHSDYRTGLRASRAYWGLEGLTQPAVSNSFH
jgi:hypothetical protein